jgi:hypothetical protein
MFEIYRSLAHHVKSSTRGSSWQTALGLDRARLHVSTFTSATTDLFPSFNSILTSYTQNDTMAGPATGRPSRLLNLQKSPASKKAM